MWGCSCGMEIADNISILRNKDHPDGIIGIFHWHNPSLPHYGPGVDSTSNRSEYQEYFLGVKAAGA